MDNLGSAKDYRIRTIARRLGSDSHLDTMQHTIPEAQYNALYLLADGLPVQHARAAVAQYAPKPREPVLRTGLRIDLSARAASHEGQPA